MWAKNSTKFSAHTHLSPPPASSHFLRANENAQAKLRLRRSPFPLAHFPPFFLIFFLDVENNERIKEQSRYNNGMGIV